jgi:hypothetical protein
VALVNDLGMSLSANASDATKTKSARCWSIQTF